MFGDCLAEFGRYGFTPPPFPLCGPLKNFLILQFKKQEEVDNFQVLLLCHCVTC